MPEVSPMPDLIRAELLKLRRRTLTWVLFVLLVAFLGLVHLGLYMMVQAPPAEGMPPGLQEQMVEELLTFPRAFAGILGMVAGIGTFLAIVLGGASMGGEYGWGTVRTVLARGPGRGPFLLVKLSGLAIILAIGLVIGFVVGSLLSGLTAVAIGQGVRLASVPAGFIGDLAVGAVKAWAVLCFYALFGLFLSTLGRSTLAGVAGGLVYYFVDSLAGQLFPRAAPYLLGANTNALLAFSGGRMQVGINVGSAASPQSLSPGHAAVVLGVYAALFLAASLLLFQRRDITA